MARKQYILSEKMKFDGLDKPISYEKISHDVNGNPRYLVNIMEHTNSYEAACKIAKPFFTKSRMSEENALHFKITSYALQDDLKRLLVAKLIEGGYAK